MIFFKKKWVCFSVLMMVSCLMYAHDVGDELLEPNRFLPATEQQANWAFSGLVTNENGDHYAYFFQMQRHDSTFHVMAALFDADTHLLISQDDAQAMIAHPEQYDWQVGHSFLRFNTMNNSWVFGLKAEDKKGFNFKVDMLNQPENRPVPQDLREGIAFITSQTSPLSGHIQIGDEGPEQFVTSQHAWFRQIWLTQPQNAPHLLTSALCRFNDGSGFHAMTMVEQDVTRGAVAGWFDEQGVSSAVSQFIHIKEDKDGAWNIRIASPNVHLTLSDVFKKSEVVSGFVSKNNTSGYCLLSDTALG
jgi:hypothetical protein